jgi:hypothetical protein
MCAKTQQNRVGLQPFAQLFANRCLAHHAHVLVEAVRELCDIARHVQVWVRLFGVIGMAVRFGCARRGRSVLERKVFGHDHRSDHDRRLSCDTGQRW